MMAGKFSSISASLMLVITVAACSDATAPASSVATVTKVAATETIPGDSEGIAAAFDDAASRLMLSFPSTPTAIELNAALVAAAGSFRDGDMGAASAAIVIAGRALNSIDAKESNPDAAAVRLVLRYASRASTSLAVQSR